MKSVAAMCHGKLPLMVQATSQYQGIADEAKQHGVSLLFEAFSDRRYTDEGYLQSRQIDGAVLSSQEALVQAKQLIEQGTVTTASGATLSIQANSLCVHGDTAGAVEIARQIRAYL
jgi:UPF0271 protein